MGIPGSVRLLTLLTSGLLLHASVAAADPSLPKDIDASGESGKDGTPGTKRSSSAAEGKRGADGGHAGRSTRGQDAGDIDVTLEVPKDAKGPVKGKIVIRGTMRTSPNKSESIQGQFDIGKDGSVNLRARGGAGGRGGRGGDAEDGGRGTRGADASQIAKGADGGAGGDGGRGGDGTPGSEGGRGGKLTVNVKAENTHLLMLVEHQESGGAGGAGGANGRGGNGGPGGAGGESFKWNTTREVEYTETEMDPNGGIRHVTKKKTVDVPHENKGGDDGPGGKRGADGSGDLSSGAQAKHGSFGIAVHGEGGTQRYESRYDIAIKSYDIQPKSANGIIEPGEEVTVSRVVVKNSGGMPTPAHHPIQVFLEYSNWAVSRPIQLKIPRALAPGEEIELPGNLMLDISDRAVAPLGDRFVEGDRVVAASWLPEVDRAFKDGKHTVNTKITFPVEIEPIDGWNSLSPGKVTKVRWRIKNVSSREIGQSAELKRLLNTHFKESPGSKAPVVIYDSEKREVTLAEGLLTKIERLKPGETQVIEGYVGIKKGATAYDHAKVEIDLNLGAPMEPGKGRVVQRRAFTIQVGEGHQHNVFSNVLLVTNEKTTKEQIDAWKKTYEALGQKVDTLNLSHEGNLDFTKVFDDFAWSSVVMLNEDIHVPGTGKARPEDFMSKTQFLRAAAQHGVRVTVIGGTRAGPNEFLKDMLIPSSQFRKPVDYKTEQKFRDFAGKIAKVGVGSGDKTADLNVDWDHDVPVERTYFFRKPNTERSALQSEKAALKLSQDLTSQRPDLRYMVFHEPIEPKVTGKGPLGIGTRYQVGRMVVGETFDSQTFSGLIVGQTLGQAHDPKYITGADNVFTAALALQPKHKVLAFREFLEGKLPSLPGMDRKQVGELLSESLINDIAAEQRALVSQKWNQGFNDAMLKASMPILDLVTSDLELNVFTADSVESEIYLKFVAKLRRMSKNQVGWWQYLLPSMRTRRVAGVALPMLERLMVRGFGSPGKARRNEADKKLAKIEKQMKADEGRFTSETLTEALNSKRGITTDVHVAVDSESRVLPMSEHRNARAVDATREAKRDGMDKSINAAKKEFIQEWECGAQVDCVRVATDRVPGAEDVTEPLPTESLADAEVTPKKCIPRELEKAY